MPPDFSKLTLEQLSAIIAGKALPASPDALDVAASTPEVPSALVRVGRGAADVTQGLKQKYLNWTDPEAAQQYTQEVNQDVANYEKGRKQGAPSGAGYDFLRLAGNVGMAAPVALVPGGGMGLVPRFLSGAGTGAAGGYAGFNPENTSTSNMINAGVGAAAGGVLNAAAPRIVEGVVSGAQFAKNKLAEGLRSLIPDTTIIIKN